MVLWVVRNVRILLCGCLSLVVNDLMVLGSIVVIFLGFSGRLMLVDVSILWDSWFSVWFSCELNVMLFICDMIDISGLVMFLVFFGSDDV